MKNNFKLKSMSLLVGATFAALATNVIADNNDSLTVQAQTSNGSPYFVTGNFGSMTQKNAVSALKSFLTANEQYGFTGKEDFQIKRQWIDDLGKLHTHFDQTINGIKVYGNSLIVHANATPSSLTSANAQGNIYAVTGALSVDSSPSSSFAMISSNDNGRNALSVAQSIGDVSGDPELSYIYIPETGATKLAWRMEVSWNNGPGDFGRDFVYVDAKTSDIVTRHPQVHSAKSWRTYTLNGGSSNQAPGQLLCTNNQSCGNASAQRAHDGASTVYNYYSQRHGRDSLNNAGMALVSSVQLGEANAYWTGQQMIYGQAGGGVDNDFTSDFDVIGHEFTHGVTQFTAGLIYRNESGALNEAWSDIFGVTAEAFKNGTTSSTWLLGDGLYNTPGRAFRYMNNPTKDGQSRDYYPERYQGSQDNGGVHLNSGIANLAYTMLVDGGSHPRGKTSAQVPSIGMAKAEKIFYRALTTYMNQNTNFAGGRSATAQAAQELFGASEKFAVETAWCAVGVGTCPTTNPDPDPDPDPDPGTELQNGVAKTGISGSQGGSVNYTMQVPSGATSIRFAISGGSGDADLYVRFGAAPTDSAYDCRPYIDGNAESCNVSQSGGTYYVRLKGYRAFSGVSLVGSYSGGTTPPGNEAPTASFTSSCNSDTCSFDASGSSDRDGQITSYSWTFGDGSSSTGSSVSHTYNAAGSYSVTLTVRDDDNATDSTSKTVTIDDSTPPGGCAGLPTWNASTYYYAGTVVAFQGGQYRSNYGIWYYPPNSGYGYWSYLGAC